MVDFNDETRKRCRHCKMKLPEPTSNERQAFCTWGCYGSFYLHRCRVCEAAFSKAKGRPRVICKKAKCRNAWNAGEGFGKYATANFSQVSKNPEKSSKNAMDLGLFGASGTVERTLSTVALSRPWRVVAAGSPITANVYHCAVVSDAPNGGLPDILYAKVWADGDWQATETRNRKLLEKRFAGLKVETRTSPATTINAGRVASLVATIPDDLSIPPFLDRRPLPLQRAA